MLISSNWKPWPEPRKSGQSGGVALYRHIQRAGRAFEIQGRLRAAIIAFAPAHSVFKRHDDAKSSLSRLVKRAASGEEIVIAKNGKPVARLTRLSDRKSTAPIGAFAGKLHMAEDFDASPNEQPVKRVAMMHRKGQQLRDVRWQHR